MESGADEQEEDGGESAAGEAGGRGKRVPRELVGLVLVPSPIGNLGDVGGRVKEALAGAVAIACEDTRHSRILLAALGVSGVPLVSLHEHNEASRCGELVELMRGGGRVCVLSDAGYPGVSDPGQRLIAACIREGLQVGALPGPSAVMTALAGSGLPTVPFYFGGFLPPKSGRRDKELAAALGRECTSVYFESPHRLVRSLGVLAERDALRRVVVARELSKIYEEYRRGGAGEVLAHYEARPPKGEITLLVSGTELPKWMGW